MLGQVALELPPLPAGIDLAVGDFLAGGKKDTETTSLSTSAQGIMKARLRGKQNGKRNLRYNLSRRVELSRLGRVGGEKRQASNLLSMGLRIKGLIPKG